MNESYIRKKFLEVARKEFNLFAFPIESGLVQEGIPDVCLIRGKETSWIELKYVSDFPRRQTTPVNSHLLRESQQEWFKKYNEEEAGGGFILVRVMNAYFLFRSYWAATLNDFVEEDYYVRCFVCGSAKNPETLRRVVGYIANRVIAIGKNEEQVTEAKESFNSKIPEDMF